MTNAAPLAPGARVVIRDAEWIVRRVDRSRAGGLQLLCDGASELVRGREGVFLTALERKIQVLDPAETRLVADRSPGFADSLLYIESQLRQVVPNDERIHIGHQAAMDKVPYQLAPARQALRQPRQRILIADAVGLGKTLESGILVSELIARGRGRRILVLAVKSMLTQFQKEFWNRFTIPLTRLDSSGIQRVRSRIPTNHNPFNYYDRSIISIDTLKQDREYRTWLEQAYWDIIVIDEAHNVAERGSGSLRSRLARLLSRRSDALIMLSATPHDGSARSFASLMGMLDPTAIRKSGQHSHNDFRDRGLVIRRFKKDVQGQVREAFRDREIHRRRFAASDVEEAAFEALLAVRIAPPRNRRSARTKAPIRDLFLVSLEKALFSSPAACRKSIRERIRRVEKKRNPRAPGVETELASLRRLNAALEPIIITPDHYSKYQALLAAIRGGAPFRWKSTRANDRLVIFTERIETLRWLQQALTLDLKLRIGQLVILHGGMSDVEQQRVVEAFGTASSGVRLLVCSDVAAEGINLHYSCHRLIHFDMPWSLMVFAQRNGRVDRYGQKRTPRIVYLVTESRNPTIRGDTRILEVLEAKDRQAYNDIGDPSAFMNVRDITAEEDITREAVAKGERHEDFDSRLQPQPSAGDDLLALFLGDQSGGLEGSPAPPAAPTPEPPRSLFPDELTWCEVALHRLRDRDPRETIRFEVDHASSALTLDAPPDLERRFRRNAPREVWPRDARFHFTANRDAMNRAIVDSRREEGSWPRVSWLWRLNPVAEWLNERMVASFGRHEAPVLAGSPGLAPEETVFLCSGLVPNRKSHPLLYEWIGVGYRGDDFDRLYTLEDILERTGVGRTAAPNRGLPVDEPALRRLLPDAVERSRARILDLRAALQGSIDERLDRELKALRKLREGQLFDVKAALQESTQPRRIREGQAARRRRRIAEVFSEYEEWARDTMKTEPMPHIAVVAVLTGA